MPTMSLPSRVERWGSAPAKAKVDAIVLLKPENTFNAAGYNPIIVSMVAAAVIIPKQKPKLLVFVIREGIAKLLSFLPDEDVLGYGNFFDFVPFAPTWQEGVGKILTQAGITQGVLGVEGTITWDQMEALQKALPEFTLEKDTVKPVIEEIRHTLDPDQASNHDIASKIIAAGGARAFEVATKERGTATQVACQAEIAMLKYREEHFPDVMCAGFGSSGGGKFNSNVCWAVVGDMREFITTYPMNIAPKDGQSMTVYLWAGAGGMSVELEFTIPFGTTPDEAQRNFATNTTARNAMVAAVKPGVTYGALYDVGEARLRAGGCTAIPGRMGHSMNEDEHGARSISKGNHTLLKEGDVLTIEPCAYGRRDLMCQSSVTVRVTQTGCDRLTKVPKELEV